MENIKGQQWVKGAIYLSLAALFVKGLSALYKVPYQNLTGDIGYYVYQQVYPLYGVAFVLGTYGIPLVISTILTEDRLSGRREPHLIPFLFLSVFLLNGFIGALLLIFAEQIAFLMGDSQLTDPIRWLGLPYFIIPFLAIGRGFFQSEGNMVPTAISQVVEQTIRVIVILLIAALSLGQPYLAGTSAGIGAFFGGVTGALVILFYWNRQHTYSSWRIGNSKLQLPENWRQILKKLFVASFFVSVSAMALILFQLIDSFTVFRLLNLMNIEPITAASLKGIYDRGWPMVQMGAVVTTVFSYGVLPFLTKAHTENNLPLMQQYVRQSVKICIVFGGAASVGLIVIMPNLNPMLFMDRQGTVPLQVLAATVLFGALFMTIAALLHAVGKGSVAGKILLCGLMMKLIGNSMAIPFLGITGASLSTALSFMLMSFLMYLYLRKMKLMSRLGKNLWIKWIVSLLAMAIIVAILQQGILFLEVIVGETRLLYSVAAIMGALFGAIIFVWIIWRFRLFTKEEWESLPKLSKYFPYEK
ncbi:MAG: polysaccharide biosynthesis protein [Bacillus sp. (in: Bacteria)]|nr:polysaccharide biosynthesis protein [Bacillus sp. (in: firmicutes)]